MSIDKTIIIEEGDERHALFHEGLTDIEPVERIVGARESHVYSEGGGIIPRTRGIFTPRAKKGDTFRQGDDHLHPMMENGVTRDHGFHVLQEQQNNPMAKQSIRLFRRRVQEFREQRKENL